MAEEGPEDEKAEALRWAQAEKAGVVQPEEEKAPGWP